MPFYEKNNVRIHYEETGTGYPLLIIPGGGLNATLGNFTGGAPFNPMEEFKNEYRCIAADLRNANGGQSSGPLEIDRPWDARRALLTERFAAASEADRQLVTGGLETLCRLLDDPHRPPPENPSASEDRA